MLDSEMQDVQTSAGVLKGQRVLVLGACCGFGRGMVRALGAAGAQVIAADSSAEALKEVSGAVPLTLNGTPEQALRRVGRAWGDARLDAVLNLMPLRHPAALDMNIEALQGIVQGFMPALSLREGQIVTVVARPEQALDVGAGAMEPALASAQSAFAHALRRDGLSLNMITLRDATAAPVRKAVIGLLAKSLGSLSGAELRL